ncbi:hypothetical protein I4U23_001392 [Adineta vaga]|nr:hypothetical protein I4U23_001392 [Adineta vaga]
MAYVKYILLFITLIDYTGGNVICGTNEYLARCSQPLACQSTCAEPDRMPCLTLACIRGCECQENYVRDTDRNENNVCIKRDECQNNRNSTCGSNEIESNCVNPCQPSCVEPIREPCPTFVCSKGCTCADGFIRTTDDTSSACIPNDQCSRR